MFPGHSALPLATTPVSEESSEPEGKIAQLVEVMDTKSPTGLTGSDCVIVGDWSVAATGSCCCWTGLAEKVSWKLVDPGGVIACTSSGTALGDFPVCCGTE